MSRTPGGGKNSCCWVLNMKVSLCIRQGLKINDDSVSVEELDWSAERQVLIPAEHLWCDFKCRPWAKNSSPNTNDLYIHYMDKSAGNVWNVWNYCTHMYKSLVFGDTFLAQGLHLKSHQRCSAGIRSRPVKFFHTDWIIISLWSLPYTQRHCHVRI